jgi:hypothetical protein
MLDIKATEKRNTAFSELLGAHRQEGMKCSDSGGVRDPLVWKLSPDRAGFKGSLEWTETVSRPTEHDKININWRRVLRNVRIGCMKSCNVRHFM